LSDLPLAEQSWQSILLFWFFQLLFLKFCLEQFQHMLFCLQDSCFANRFGLTRFFKKLLHNVSCIAHRIVGPSASTGVTHRSDLLKLYSSTREEYSVFLPDFVACGDFRHFPEQADHRAIAS